jgi:uncharacterized protein (TIGR00730 family)
MNRLQRWIVHLLVPPYLGEKSKKLKGEARFLADRYGRLDEALRVFRIAFEFIRGFRALHFVGPGVTVFGSARFDENHRYYKIAVEVSKALAQAGFTVFTGGGPGIMEAANRGARLAGGPSVGCNINLPHEQKPNRFLTTYVNFRYFFVRKVMLIKYSYAFVIMPGGFGTLDEMAEALTLIQTGKLKHFPVVLMGRDYWKGFLDWVQTTMVEEKTIAAEDFNIFIVTDDPHEACRYICDNSGRVGLKLKALSAMVEGKA